MWSFTEFHQHYYSTVSSHQHFFKCPLLTETHYISRVCACCVARFHSAYPLFNTTKVQFMFCLVLGSYSIYFLLYSTIQFSSVGFLTHWIMAVFILVWPSPSWTLGHIQNFTCVYNSLCVCCCRSYLYFGALDYCRHTWCIMIWKMLNEYVYFSAMYRALINTGNV